MEGNAVDSPWSGSGERFIYTELFSRRPDIHAIAHFHPPMATAFSAFPASVRLDARELHHLAPFLGLFHDELAELAG
jgi:ribulose-5-phosphate 4-epimerase/fuculose-1-phosphate aldolase